uniref:FAD-binding monooxygenase BOA2 ) n=1 Tax=Ganoderma boninense TaxID=34458 RepID=A0A5K1JT65_9APHY|nr:FAD-binding monooxygenase BOA2 (EC (Botcinic acid biosynthesis cluster A protein 2) [Ganoderma boninense]
MAFDLILIASQWLSECTFALRNADAKAFGDLLLPEGWLRDILVFTWDVRALEGRKNVTAFLNDRLRDAQIEDLRLNETPHLVPRVYAVPMSAQTGVQFAFTFECQHGHGRGYVRLAPDTDGAYRAFTVLAELADLRGHEELGTLPPPDESAETNPHVIIGLQVAARFKRMNIPTLLIERNARVGDNWRERYPTLTLNTIRRHHTLLYEPYPSGWPEFTPRDKLADWLEHYAAAQNLAVWTDSELAPHPTYDTHDRRWDVTVVRAGFAVKLRPAHIVLATGTLGRPLVPAVPGMEGFGGRVVHSAHFAGGAAFAGMRAVVVGAGNSAADICEDLALAGAASVTMVQRSPTRIVTRDFFCAPLRAGWPEDVPLDVLDFRFVSMGFGLMKRIMVPDQVAAWEANRELYENLRKGGVSFELGSEGQVLFPEVFERFGGMDKGASILIADGRIKVKSLVSLKCFTKNSLILSDQTELPADVVVFAPSSTGYNYIRETNIELLGEDIINQTGEVFGLDSEGEIKGSYRPCGHPGLWFATGGFPTSRCLSKPLALQIKAIELGIMSSDERRLDWINQTS